MRSRTGPPPDRAAPVLATRLPAHVRRTRRSALVAKVRVGCSEACDVRVRVVIDDLEFAYAVHELAAGETATFTTTSDAEQRSGVRGRHPRRATLEVIRRAFESAGVEFIDENGGGPGVRLQKRQKKMKSKEDRQRGR